MAENYKEVKMPCQAVLKGGRLVRKVGFFVLLGVVFFGFVPSCQAREVKKEAYWQFLFAQGLFREGKFDLAAEEFQRFIDTFPEDEDCDKAQYFVGVSLWYQKEYRKAALSFQNILKNYPASELIDASLYFLGECYYQLSRYNEAVVCFNELIKEYPQSELVPFSLCSLGCAYLQLKKYDEAMKVFEKMKNTKPFPRELFYKGEVAETAPKAVRGPLGARGIVRAVYPVYPEWAEKRGIEGSVELRPWVLPNGKVFKVEILRSSGWRELDECAIKALMQWKFEPIEGDEIQGGESSVEFIFTFKK